MNILEGLLIGLFFAVFAPFVFFISFLSIFFPNQYTKEHLESCLLKHRTIRDRFYHFWDTRGGLLTFNHRGIKPSKNSPNYRGYLLREIEFYQEEIKEDTGYFKGYKDHCVKKLMEANEALSKVALEPKGN